MGNKMHYTSQNCRSCEFGKRKSNRPSVFQLIEDFSQLKSFVQVGKKYGISDTAVRKWLKYYRVDEDMVKRKSSAQNESVVKTIV